MNERPFLIKICGITREIDARLAVEYGANALGFNFCETSPRFIEPERAVAILERIPHGILKVGVVVMGRRFFEDLPEWLAGRLDMIQIHGLQPGTHVSCFAGFPGRILIAAAPEDIERFGDAEILVDTSWGRGIVADWKQLESVSSRYVLSGGLHAGNVAEAIRLLSPNGVDVCSGIESSTGIKDPVELKRFLAAVASALRQRG